MFLFIAGFKPATSRAKWRPLYHRLLMNDLFCCRKVEHLNINKKYRPPRLRGWNPQKNRIVPKKSTPGPNQKHPRISGSIDFNNTLRPNYNYYIFLYSRCPMFNVECQMSNVHVKCPCLSLLLAVQTSSLKWEVHPLHENKTNERKLGTYIVITPPTHTHNWKTKGKEEGQSNKPSLLNNNDKNTYPNRFSQTNNHEGSLVFERRIS